jgi:hypothetical protein
VLGYVLAPRTTGEQAAGLTPEPVG